MVSKYLLDTHTFIWATQETEVFRLGDLAREVIEDPESDLYVSSVSIFEIANKNRKGKLPEYQDLAENYLESLYGLEAHELPLDWEQANLAGSLDWPHGDPFDRMLAAQAQTEGMTLITCDKVFDDAPNVDILW